MIGKDDPKPYQVYLGAWRAKRGLTQEKVAERLEVVHTTVGRWESGTIEITSNHLVALCHLYEVTPQQLLGPPSTAPLTERVAEIQRLAENMDQETLDHLIFVAKRMRPTG